MAIEFLVFDFEFFIGARRDILQTDRRTLASRELIIDVAYTGLEREQAVKVE